MAEQAPCYCCREIVAVLSGQEWSADTPDEIATILKLYGFKIEEPHQVEEPPNTEHWCGNCDEVYPGRDLRVRWPNIPDLDCRIDPGGIVPSGECPQCGALVYLRVKGAAV